MEPALSAEDWAEWYASDSDDGTIQESWHHSSPLRAAGQVTTGTEQAVAALCLHGQPFGFTREDVELLHQAAGDAESEARPYPDGCAEARAPFDNLADRIEALLPPEAP